MKQNIVIFFILAFLTSECYSQGKKYWDQPDSIRKKIADYYYNWAGIIYVDSALYQKLENFYKNETQSGYPSKKPDPGYFGVREILTNKNHTEGIFKTRTRSFHVSTYVFTYVDEKFKYINKTKSKNKRHFKCELESFIDENRELFNHLSDKEIKKKLRKEVKLLFK